MTNKNYLKRAAITAVAGLSLLAGCGPVSYQSNDPRGNGLSGIGKGMVEDFEYATNAVTGNHAENEREKGYNAGLTTSD